MGWWATGRGDDVIGDEPADTMTAAMEALAVADDRPTTLPALLDSVAATLREHAGQVWAGTPDEVRTLSARVEPGGTLVPAAGGEPDRQRVHDLSEALASVAEDYLEALERLPRLHEVLALLAFVLGDRPDAVLSGLSPGDSVQELRPS
jgi:hypothetical protein